MRDTLKPNYSHIRAKKSHGRAKVYTKQRKKDEESPNQKSTEKPWPEVSLDILGKNGSTFMGHGMCCVVQHTGLLGGGRLCDTIDKRGVAA